MYGHLRSFYFWFPINSQVSKGLGQQSVNVFLLCWSIADYNPKHRYTRIFIRYLRKTLEHKFQTFLVICGLSSWYYWFMRSLVLESASGFIWSWFDLILASFSWLLLCHVCLILLCPFLVVFNLVLVLVGSSCLVVFGQVYNERMSGVVIFHFLTHVCEFYWICVSFFFLHTYPDPFFSSSLHVVPVLIALNLIFEGQFLLSMNLIKTGPY